MKVQDFLSVTECRGKSCIEDSSGEAPSGWPSDGSIEMTDVIFHYATDAPSALRSEIAYLLHDLILKMVGSPRQARDEHRGSTQTERVMRFLTAACRWIFSRARRLARIRKKRLLLRCHSLAIKKRTNICQDRLETNMVKALK